jgi:hypothetical protein
MAIDSEQIGSWRSQITNFTQIHGTRPRIVALPQQAIQYSAGIPEISTTAIRGSKITALSLAAPGTTTSPGSVILYKLTKIGTVSSWGTTTITSTTTITRTTGSFITDGFQTYERYLLQGWTGASNAAPFYANDIIIQPTAMTATALTVTGLTNDTAVTSTGTIWRLTQMAQAAITASAGTYNGTSYIGPVSLIDRGILPHLPATSPSPLNSIFLGTNDAIAIALGTACTGTQTVEIMAELGDA